MTQIEHDKIINLMKHAALQGIDTGRLDGKREDVIPIEDAIEVIDCIWKSSHEQMYQEKICELNKHKKELENQLNNSVQNSIENDLIMCCEEGKICSKKKFSI